MIRHVDDAPTPSTQLDPVLRVEGVTKTFAGAAALKSVSLSVGRGQIHALAGGNGSGKSTLIKIIAGVYHADPGGVIEVDGVLTPAESMTPAIARSLGLHFVHQNSATFPDMSVTENLAVGTGYETSAIGRIRWAAQRRRAAELLERFEINVDPGAAVRTLRPAERSMLAIARALGDQEGERSGVLVLDEPTASLPHAEVEHLMEALRRFADAGQTILFVSHRLNEVIDACDSATVLRDGNVAGELVGSDITERRLIELIAGRPLDAAYPAIHSPAGGVVALELDDVSGGPLRGVNLEVHRGEVLGIAGLLGSGRSELLKMLFGALPLDSGELRLEGVPVTFAHIGEAMRAGVAYVPEDRTGEAAFGDLDVTENLSSASLDRYWSRLRLRKSQERSDAQRSITEHLIRTSSSRQHMGTLSGGNQQKVVLARWLRRKPAVLLLDEPTQGVDVGARAEIYQLVGQAVADGCAVVLVTSDFEELAAVSDRVVILCDGEVSAELRPPHITPARLTELAYRTEEVSR